MDFAFLKIFFDWFTFSGNILSDFVLLWENEYNIPIIGKPHFHFWLTCFLLQKNSGNFTNSIASCKVLISNINISKTVSHSIINNTIFWKCVTRTSRCIYVNCCNRSRFLAKVSTKLQKMYFFRQFKDHNSGREQEN